VWGRKIKAEKFNRSEKKQRCRAAAQFVLDAVLVGVTMLPFHRPDVRPIFFERIDMHHPVEDHRMVLLT
jgi:hypothetical protein